jgi:hypothetical protein
LKKKSKKEHNNNDEEETSLKKDNSLQPRFGLIPIAVFLFTMSVVIMTLISVIFPALIASNNSTFQNLKEIGIVLLEVEAFQLGIWSVPLIILNVTVFISVLLYFKNKLPKLIIKSIDFIFSFEVSKKISFIVIIILLSIYVGFSWQELIIEEEWEDYPNVKQRLERWSPDQISKGFEPHVKYFMHWSSMIIFGHYTVIPFIASVSLLLITYFFTFEISKKRFAGIIAMVILLQSNLFLTYDSTVSYTNFWIMFYLLSLYLLYKVWPLSPVSYVSTKIKVILASSISTIIIAGIIVVITGANIGGIAGEQEEFDTDEFLMGFTSFSFQLRFDGLIQIFILPLIVGLFIASRYGIHHADSIMVFIGGILFIAPLVTGFTELTNQPYRFVPLVVFFAIGVGVLLSKNKK